MKLSPFSGTASLKLLRGAAGEGNPVLGEGGMGNGCCEPHRNYRHE